MSRVAVVVRCVLASFLLLAACGDGDEPSPLCVALTGDALLETRGGPGVAFPVERLGKPALLGGALISVSDHQDDFVGSLKTYKFDTLAVTPRLVQSGGRSFVEFVGCEQACDEGGESRVLLRLSVAGRSCAGDILTLSGDAVSAQLGLARLFGEPGLEWLRAERLLELEQSRTTWAELDADTLVFDTEGDVSMSVQSYPDDPDTAERKQVRLRTRWFLKSAASLDAAFEPRPAVDVVGFFTTTRHTNALVSRWSFAAGRTVTYYVKNVPAAYHPALAEAFAGWNEALEDELGHAPLRYELLAEDDPRHASITTGDPRYAVLEWDLVDRATYGGVGQSYVDPRTGEIFSATILVQGPQALELYGAWFALSGQVQELRARGEPLLAERALRDGLRRLHRGSPRPTRVRPGPRPRFDPPPRFDFDLPPEGETFESFMHGMMRELFQHEIGHTLGLTHNFKGSLGADETRTSSSVMEYVARVERHRTQLAEYDRQAIGYGYGGRLPTAPEPFCQDGQVNYGQADLSPECSSDDSGADPFRYLREQRVQRALDLLVGRGLSEPVWTFADLASQFYEGLYGMTYYALAAEATSDQWLNFFADASRPSAPAEIRSYVLAELEATLCDPSLEAELSALAARRPEAAEAARGEIEQARAAAREVGEWLELPIVACAEELTQRPAR